MRNYWVVFQFEFIQQLKKKAVIVSTIISALIVSALLVAPTMLDTNSMMPTPIQSVSNNLTNALPDAGFYVVDKTFENIVTLDENSLYPSEAALVEAVKSGKIRVGFVVNGLDAISAIYDDKLSEDRHVEIFESIVKEAYINQQLAEKGLSVEEFHALNDFSIHVSEQVLGKDSMRFVFVNFIFMMAVYILVLMYGQSVATSIAREKDSKAMELLITSTKPKTLIVGKVLAGGLVAFCQLLVLFLISFVTYQIVKGQYPIYIRMLLENTLTLDSILVYCVFGLIGFLLYLFIFASLGSLVNRMEDINGVITPVILLFVVGYFLANMAMSSPNMAIVQIGSWIPFFSLMVMPIRYTLSNITLIELGSTLLIMLLTIGVFAYLSIRIYQWGSLNYGNKVSLIKAIKSIFSSK